MNGLQTLLLAAYASTIAGLTVSYYLGDEETRAKIHFAIPFLIPATLFAAKIYEKK